MYRVHVVNRLHVYIVLYALKNRLENQKILLLSRISFITFIILRYLLYYIIFEDFFLVIFLIIFDVIKYKNNFYANLNGFHEQVLIKKTKVCLHEATELLSARINE